MKLYKINVLIVFFSFLLTACIDEPAQPATEKEIISEISREWTCNMDEEGFPVDFTAVISPDGTDASRVLINNFHKIGNDLSISVIVRTDLTLEIPEQTINNQVFKGVGLISDDYTEITWNYSIEDENGDISHVTGKYFYGVSS